MLGKIPAARLALIEKIVAHAPSERAARAARAGARIPAALSSAASPKKICARIVPRTWPPRRSRTWNSAAGARAAACCVDIAPPLDAERPPPRIARSLRVVAPDMPFLVESIGIVFSQMNIAVHLIVHPVLAVRRDARGTSQGGRHGRAPRARRILADDRNRPAARRSAGAASSNAASAPSLEDVRKAVDDFPRDARAQCARWPTNSIARACRCRSPMPARRARCSPGCTTGISCSSVIATTD